MSLLLSIIEHILNSRGSDRDSAPVAAVTTYYRTRDGLADYRFSIERQTDGTYRAYILSQPSYGSRATGAHETHRLSSGGRHYVCWNRPLRAEDEAKRVAALWADATQEYIKTGRRF